MAYEITMWEKDGKGESMIKSIRIRKVSEIPAIVEYWSRIPECVLILKERTDNREDYEQLWIREGYVNPF